jgi:hypothetical protein
MYFYMGWTYLHKNDGSKAFAWTQKGLEFYPNDLDLNYQMARIGFQAKMDDLLKTHAEKYFELLPKFRNRGVKDTSDFINLVDESEWSNRTIYTVDEAAEISMRKYLEAA